MKLESERLLKLLLEAVRAPSNASADPTFMKWAADTIEKIVASESHISDTASEVKDLRNKYRNRNIN